MVHQLVQNHRYHWQMSPTPWLCQESCWVGTLPLPSSWNAQAYWRWIEAGNLGCCDVGLLATNKLSHQGSKRILKVSISIVRSCLVCCQFLCYNSMKISYVQKGNPQRRFRDFPHRETTEAPTGEATPTVPCSEQQKIVISPPKKGVASWHICERLNGCWKIVLFSYFSLHPFLETSLRRCQDGCDESTQEHLARSSKISQASHAML